MTKHDRKAGWDRAWGLHSNIPECCVEAYVTKNMPSPVRGWGYRPCWDCHRQGLKGQVKVHNCTSECIPFLQSLNFSRFDIGVILRCNRKMKTFNDWRRKEVIRKFFKQAIARRV
jgi:hypothetical protein